MKIRMPRSWFLLVLVSNGLLACSSRAQTPPEDGFSYPQPHTVDQVDDYHGTKVEDPYRWMEEPDSPELREWIEAQNKITFGWLHQGSDRRRIRERIEELWNYEKVGVPNVEGGRYYYRRNSGLENQSSLYVADAVDAEPRLVMDPNKLSEDGTVALASTWFSPDGRYMGYSLAEAGSDWRTLHVRDMTSGEDLPADVIRHVKFSGGTWNAEGSGFYYRRLEPPKEGEKFVAANDGGKIYYHSLGTSQDEDVLVYERPDQPDWSLYPGTTEDGRYLFIYAGRVGSKNYAIFVKDLKGDGEVKPVLDQFDSQTDLLGNDGSLVYAVTDYGAPRRRIVKFDLNDPGYDKWTDVIPEGKEAIDEVSLIGDRFFVHRLHNAQSRVTVHTLDGKLERSITLPGPGTVWGLEGRRKDTETFYAFTSPIYPPTIFRYTIGDGRSTVFRKPEVDFDPENFVTKQVVYKSRDGTPVTMFISHRRGLLLDGKNPTLLHGYGGFNIPITPYFSVSNLVWMEMGGVFCDANLRGGGEKGKEWHEAGMLDRKQNVFDDFIAAAEALCANGYTSPDKLAIMGGSNGGLLVGACLNQRPDLFAAAVPQVGVMDMLRYHRFTAGRHWVSEYGSAEDPEMFPTLFGYSPYHNIKKRAYPAVLITTADHDDRVVPAHSFKYAARLQAMQTGTAPILIRIETRAGHGAGTPTSKRIDETADIWTFLARTLRMKVKFRG